jgi:hypothetical protein
MTKLNNGTAPENRGRSFMMKELAAAFPQLNADLTAAER